MGYERARSRPTKGKPAASVLADDPESPSCPDVPTALHGSGTGGKPGRKRGHGQGANTKVAETVTVDTSEGEIVQTVEEFVFDPQLVGVVKDSSRQPVNALVEVPGADNDMLMYLEWESGATIEQLATRYGVPRASVQSRVDRAHLAMLARFQGDDGPSALRADQDRVLRRVRGMAEREFNRSQGERKVVTKKSGVVGDKLTDVEEIRKEDSQPGDPRYLNVMLTATEHISRLHGVEAPKKVEHAGTQKIEVEVLHRKINELPTDQLEQLAGAWKLTQMLQRGETKLIEGEYEVKG